MSTRNGTAATGTAPNTLVNLEAAYLSALNRIVEPAARSGVCSPGIVPIGLIVLETTGWRTGRRHRTPLLASTIGGCLLVSTVRGRRSHWVENLRQSADVRYWSGGRQRTARAAVYAPDQALPAPGTLPWLLAPLGVSLACLAGIAGCAFAVLVPLECAD